MSDTPENLNDATEVETERPPALSDDELALQFSKRFDGELVFVPAQSCWLRWDGARWAKDDTLRVYDLVRSLCRSAATNIPAGAKNADAVARAVCSSKTVSAVERLARCDQRHARSLSDFDADPWALNTPGGVVDLRSGALRAHCRGDLLTRVTGAAPGGTCTRWLTFLDQITQGDQALVDFLQRWAGYTLTGVTREHAILFAWGRGGNGKSVLFGTLAKALGGYATTAMPEVFTTTRNEQHPAHLACLQGARMVLVTETEEGRPWAESRIKSLTGGDRVAARVMRGDPFEFIPVCKLWIAGNHRPVLSNPDPAMRRRLHLVPLNFVPPKPNLSLPDALEAELPGILQWAIEGCMAWQRVGLAPPAIVTDAVDDYFAEQDIVGTWFAERCERVPGEAVSCRTLFADWEHWAKQRREAVGTEMRFSAALERKAVKKRTAKGMVFKDVALRFAPQDVCNK